MSFAYLKVNDDPCNNSRGCLSIQWWLSILSICRGGAGLKFTIPLIDPVTRSGHSFKLNSCPGVTGDWGARQTETVVQHPPAVNLQEVQ